MSENLAPHQIPEEPMLKIYREWADGGWGLIITGNIQVDSIHLGAAGDVAVRPPGANPNQLTLWKTWAQASQSKGSPTVVQICHPGRQSPLGAGTRGFFGKTLAPSAIPLDFGSSLIARIFRYLVFGTPRQLTYEETESVIDQFVVAAKLSFDAGFKGVELHGGHGFLIDQFLAEKSNKRIDGFGGSAAKRVEFLLRIIRKTRAVTSPSFCIGVKINSADHQGEKDLDEYLEQLHLVISEGIDYLNVSGGSFEDPSMLQSAGSPEEQNTKASTKAREAFFLSFAKILRSRFPTVPLIVTGGFRTRSGMRAALASGDCDGIGIGRPATVLPKLPKEVVLNDALQDNEATFWLKKIPPGRIVKKLSIKLIGAGVEGAYYGQQLARMGKGLKPEYRRIEIIP